MDNIFVKYIELVGLPSSALFLIASAFGSATSVIVHLTSWISFCIALLSLFVIIEKHTSIDIPFIRIKKKQDEQSDSKNTE